MIGHWAKESVQAHLTKNWKIKTFPPAGRHSKTTMQTGVEKAVEISFDVRLLVQRLFSRRLQLDSEGEEPGLLRFAAAFYDLADFFQTEPGPARASLLEQFQRVLNSAPNLAITEPEIFEYVADAIAHLKFLETQPEPERFLWCKGIISPAALEVPGMVTRDTMKYYRWLGGTLSGAGHAVEVGCWMGRSTYPLAEGLASNQLFSGRFLHTLDAFTHDKWLDDYVVEHVDEFTPQARARLERLQIGNNYLELFAEFCAPFKHLVQPRSCFVYQNAKTGEIPELEWNGEPIELFIQDISGSWPTAQKLWSAFKPSFIPNKTIVVFQQYGHMRAEGLRRFCREHVENLTPLHKPFGVAKAFRFIGG